MRTSIVILATSVAACAAQSSSTVDTSTTSTPPQVAPASARPVQTEGPIDTHIERARFQAAGETVVDTATGAVWLGTDAAGFAENFDVYSTCSYLGYRPATTAEVQALGAPLPSPFHVYAWATSYEMPAALPIVTFDGCVDVRTGAPYAGDCAIPGMPATYRSTMCVK